MGNEEHCHLQYVVDSDLAWRWKIGGASHIHHWNGPSLDILMSRTTEESR